LSPREYGAALRAGRFRRLLRSGAEVSSAVYEAGYGSSRGAYEQGGAALGMSPGAYGRGGRGARIRYTLAACAAGRLLLAATERGLCAVSLGEADEPLEAELRRQYPEASLERDDESLRPWTEALLAALEQGRPESADV